MGAVMECEDCRFWESYRDDPAFGDCMRYPPVLIAVDATSRHAADDIANWDYPTTALGQWCGEFKKKTNDGEATGLNGSQPS